MRMRWILLIALLVGLALSHRWFNQEAFLTFGPLDPHSRHVLWWWTAGTFAAYTLYELAGEQIKLWWKRRR